MGFVFQSFQLLPTLTALENVMVPLELRGLKQDRPRATALFQRVGLGARSHHDPLQLAGDKQQRSARACIAAPRMLFADEPTGNLDAKTSAQVMGLLFDLNTQAGTALVLVTHAMELVQQTQRIIRLVERQMYA